MALLIKAALKLAVSRAVAMVSCSLIFAVYASGSKQGCDYIDKAKPHIYISLETTGLVEEGKKGQKLQLVMLRLHNNSTCSIVVETDDLVGSSEGDKLFKKEMSKSANGDLITKYIPDPPEGARLPMFYDVQNGLHDSPRPVNYWYGRDLVFNYVVPAGRSVTFPIRAKFFSKRAIVSVPFNYQWEDSPDLRTMGTITHRVVFSYDLPKGFYLPE